MPHCSHHGRSNEDLSLNWPMTDLFAPQEAVGSTGDGPELLPQTDKEKLIPPNRNPFYSFKCQTNAGRLFHC